MSNIFTKLLQANKISTIQDGEKVIIACDCVLSEEHNMTSETTQYEIEDGNYINDHIINYGKTLNIEGIVSDDPLTYLQTGILDRTLTSNTPEIFKSKLNFSLGGENSKPSKEAFDQLEKIHDEKRPVVVLTGLKKYDNMVMTSLNIPRNKNTVRSLKFNATFKQVRIITTKMTYAPSTINMEEGLGAEELESQGSNTSKKLIQDDNQGLAYSFKEWAKEVFPVFKEGVLNIVTGGV